MGVDMDLRAADDSESRFAGYVEGLVIVIGHADRAGPLRDYCVGLMLPCERKSVEPMAAVTAPARVAAQHQSLSSASPRQSHRSRHGCRVSPARLRASWPDGLYAAPVPQPLGSAALAPSG